MDQEQTTEEATLSVSSTENLVKKDEMDFQERIKYIDNNTVMAVKEAKRELTNEIGRQKNFNKKQVNQISNNSELNEIQKNYHTNNTFQNIIFLKYIPCF